MKDSSRVTDGIELLGPLAQEVDGIQQNQNRLGVRQAQVLGDAFDEAFGVLPNPGIDSIGGL